MTQSPIEHFRVGSIASKPSNPYQAKQPKPAATSPNMDKRNFERLKRGKIKLEGQIDLHGMTLAQAHPALIAFIREADQNGKRLVLVITGKGRSSADQDSMTSHRGVLNHQIPHWLSIPPLATIVLQVAPAVQKHGGSGAYYVYLKRRR